MHLPPLPNEWLTCACVGRQNLFTEGMRRAREGLLLLCFLLVLYFCVFSTILYMVEYDAQKDCQDCPTCSCPSYAPAPSLPCHQPLSP